MSRFRFDSRRVEVQVQYNLPGAITYFIVYACIRARIVKSLFYIKKTLKSWIYEKLNGTKIGLFVHRT